MTIDLHYKKLIKLGTQSFDKLIADAEVFSDFTRAHNFIADYELIQKAIADRPEAEILELAIREYQFALYALSCGSYRQAFISLRLFVELALGTIIFSAHEISLRKWQSNSKDIVWSEISDTENGVFSKAFLRAFFPGIEDHGRQYGTIAETVYRECSEFVHGNVGTHSHLALAFEYDDQLARAFVDRADTIRLSILFAFAGRYLNFVPVEQRNNLEATMLENFGEISAIQEIYAEREDG